jgi:hypothetical protein
VEDRAAIENNSGQLGAEPPAAVRKLNWGAFLLTWIWGAFNNVWISLLVFVPLVNIVMPFILLFEGNKWAWQYKRWESVESFHRAQRNWAIGGLVTMGVGGAGLVTGIVALVFGLMAAMQQMEPYQLAIKSAAENQQVREALGEPIKPGFFIAGNFEENGPSGSVDISVPVSGPKGEGTIYVIAKKTAGQWKTERLDVELKKDGSRVTLLKPRGASGDDAAPDSVPDADSDDSNAGDANNE